MKQLLSVLVVVMVLAASRAASAADLAWGNSYNPASYVSAAYDWTGFYAGVNAGYSWGDAAVSVDGTAIDNVDLNPGGLNGGVQAGFNADMGGFVLGVETDIQASAISSTYTNADAEYTSKLDYYGTFRGRVGMPIEGVMPYLTAGLAYGGNTTTETLNAGPTVTDSKFHLGYAVGAGIEVGVSDQMSVKAEYLYMGLGEQTYDFGTDLENNVSLHTVRAGVNFAF